MRNSGLTKIMYHEDNRKITFSKLTSVVDRRQIKVLPTDVSTLSHISIVQSRQKCYERKFRQRFDVLY